MLTRQCNRPQALREQTQKLEHDIAASGRLLEAATHDHDVTKTRATQAKEDHTAALARVNATLTQRDVELKAARDRTGQLEADLERTKAEVKSRRDVEAALRGDVEEGRRLAAAEVTERERLSKSLSATITGSYLR